MDKQVRFEWLPGQEVNLLFDNATMLLSALVAFITVLVMLFSAEYMKGDRRIAQYYAYLSFFALSMIGLLVSDHLILLFVFWELVGFSSYLLIGFWYNKAGVSPSQRMAFMVNRVADAALFAGILLLANGSSLNMTEIREVPLLPSLLIAIGAFGKSAQLPFSGWLTKAMVGPTPVSALIHAATMVAAGVYLLYRLAPVLDEAALLAIGLTGAATAFYGGISALNQFDIKKILAYSTISQLGYMMIGIGTGARQAALFHLWTHAFFKAGLFLAAGAIMHYMHVLKPEANPQDMREMGGLKRQLPAIYSVFVVFAAALMGLPLFSGFLSKEAIIGEALAFAAESGGIAYLIPLLALLAVMLTAFYIVRMTILVFWGEREPMTKNIRVSLLVVVPLSLLAVASLWFFHNTNPVGHGWILTDLLGGDTPHHAPTWLPFVSLALIAGGGFTAYQKCHPKKQAYQLYPSTQPNGFLFEGLYVIKAYEYFGRGVKKLAVFCSYIDRKIIDWLVDFLAMFTVVFSKSVALFDRFVIDGPINLSASVASMFGKAFAGLSARQAQSQIMYFLVGLILLMVWILFVIN